MYSQYPQPQPYPQPQAPKKRNYWLIGCFGCGGALALVLGVIAIVVVLVNHDENPDGSAGAPDSPPAASSEDSGNGQEESAPAVDSDAPVGMTAESVEYEPSSLSEGGDYVAVQVTVTNNTGESLPVNPLYFTMEDASGGTKEADLMESAGQSDNFEALDLADGESETGVVVFSGSEPPASITFSGPLGEEMATVDVA